MISNDTIIKKRAKEYFKGMSLKLWLMAIKEGCKGDILSLYALCLMLDIHAIVHLHNGATWTTLKTPINDHEELLKRCPVHLAYLGMGIFVELVKQERPLQLLAPEHAGNPESVTLIIGEFVVKQEPEDTMEHSDDQRVSILKKQALTRECRVLLNRLEIDNACRSVQISSSNTSPMDKPSELLPSDENVKYQQHTDLVKGREPASPSSSEGTIIYNWQPDAH